MNVQQSRIHHYVPQWYQRRFLRDGQFKFHYLDLHPETLENNKVKYQRHSVLHWGPARCFHKEGLYNLKLGKWTTDEIERRFFGVIDNRGRNAVELFGDYSGFVKVGPENFQVLPQYMGAQRFRTPKGLDYLRKMTDVPDDNHALLFMQHVFQFHNTMWTEGIWEIARARQSPTKFIVTDEPVTFFNRRGYPSECIYPFDVALEQIGTRTLFPLSLDSCLIITHTQLVRNPWLNPTITRANARAYQQTMKYLLDTQFGRELEEDEVLRINFILKKRATRYIAAADKEWLYPERRCSTTDWSKLDDDWFLFPHLYKVPFSSGIMVGWKDGSSWAMDEYGRQPTDPKYQDKKLHDQEWATCHAAKQAWAKKREGRCVAHTEKGKEDEIEDKMMQEYLASQKTVQR
jgi:hypothetical protein